MNVEIRRTANGYMVTPQRTDQRGDYRSWSVDEDTYVFNSYQALIDKLQEILQKPEPK